MTPNAPGFGSSVCVTKTRMCTAAAVLGAQVLSVIFLALVGWGPLVSWVLLGYWALQAIVELAYLYCAVVLWHLVELYVRIFNGSRLEVILQLGFEGLVLLVET